MADTMDDLVRAAYAEMALPTFHPQAEVLPSRGCETVAMWREDGRVRWTLNATYCFPVHAPQYEIDAWRERMSRPLLPPRDNR